MPATHPDFYARWREQNEAPLFLGERDAAHPPERLLQSIWLHQRLRREDLQTLDGQPLRVLHPGFWNRAAGPDFHGAVLQFGPEPPRSGDVEIDRVPGNWQAHGHEGNPAFADVILHVVWAASRPGSHPLPALALEKFVDTPLADIPPGPGPARRRTGRNRCRARAPLRWPDWALKKPPNCFIRPRASVLSARPARWKRARARPAGNRRCGRGFFARSVTNKTSGPCSAWENCFRACGARPAPAKPARRRQTVAANPQSAIRNPQSPSRPGRRVSWAWPASCPRTFPKPARPPICAGSGDHWWRERESFSDVILPRNLWRFGGLRPANQPQRRLALAAHWLSTNDFLPRLERWFTAEAPAASLPASLLACLQAPEDDFWTWHWGLGTAPPGPAPAAAGRDPRHGPGCQCYFTLVLDAGARGPQRAVAENGG